MSTAKQVTIEFAREKETKNTVRYAEVVAEGEVTALVGVIYLQKPTAKELGNPDHIVVTFAAGVIAR